MSKEIFSGTVNRVLYESEDFKIVNLVLDGASGNRGVVAKGHFPAQAIVPGSWVSFEGKWVTDPRYGKQLRVERSPVAVQDWTNDKVLAALSAHKVGPRARENLRFAAMDLGLTLQEFLDAGDLSTVSEMDDFARQHTLTTWQSLRTYLDAASFMADAGIPPRVVSKVWSMFGSDIEALLLSDPWVLVQVPGIRFSEVDKIAIQMGVDLDNPGRARGAVYSSVQDALREGHVYATSGQIVAAANEKIPEGLESAQIVKAIKELIADKLLVVDKTTDPGTTAIYDGWHHRTEVACAKMLAERMVEPLPVEYLSEALCGAGGDVLEAFEDGKELPELADTALKVWAAGKKTPLTPDQQDAAKNALISRVSLLTGLPGTGKTTTLQAVVSIAKDAGIPFLLVAPTGIAAKRMASVTAAPASTIHRAFGASGFMDGGEEREATYAGVTGSAKEAQAGGSGQWEYGPGNPHPAQFLVVDESSMLDLHMLFRLLSGTSKSCRIMFVGDPFQLPSVGAGDVLRDLRKSKVFPHAHLTKIFRQGGTSGIVLAAHAVHDGKPPLTDEKDFIVKQAFSDEAAAEIVVALATGLHAKKWNFQVLSPRHGGASGVTELNQRLRLALNPSEEGLREMRLSGSVVREGDRVMVTQNNYTLGVYNGDVGTIARIDTGRKNIEIRVHEGPGVTPKLVKYEFKDASKSLRLAYAQTVHKSQGQEYDCIVVPVLMSYGRQLQRNLFYTAITRAKKKVFVVGTDAAIAKAVRNNKSASRNTLLGIRVRRILAEQSP